MNHYALPRPFKPHKPRKPLRNKRELAEEFGFKNAQSLAQYMLRSPVPPPKPRLHANSSGDWYDPDEMRAWRQADLLARAEQLATA
jgi:hypothetical protein